MVELLRHRLFNQNSSLSQNKSASAALEKFAKSYFTDHRQELDQEKPSQQCRERNVCRSAAESSTTEKCSQTALKSSNTCVCRKRSKTKQKTDHEDPTSGSKNARTNLKAQTEYDSAVLRAIMDEEESSKTSENPSEDSLHISEIVAGKIHSESQSKKHTKKVSGDYEYDQSTVNEAGRRLAKLRKRLEDSIQLIQKQPGLDKELLEKAYSSKMKRRRDELETIFMKDDVIEIDSLGDDTNTKNKHDTYRTGQPERKQSVQTNMKSKTSDQQSSPTKGYQYNQEICDGEPNHSTGNIQVTSPEDAVNSSDAIQETQVSESIAGLSDGQNRSIESSSLTSTSCAEEEKAQEFDELFSGKSKLDSIADNNIPVVPSKELRPMMGDTLTKSHKEASEEMEGNHSKKDSNSTAESPGKTRANNRESKSDAIGLLSSSGKFLDEGRLDAILERQSKRREDLRQRKRINIDSMLAARAEQKDAHAENNSKEACPISEAECPTVTKEHPHTEPTEQHPDDSVSEQDANIGEENTNSVQLSPIIMDGTPFLIDSKPKSSDPEVNKNNPDKSCREPANTVEERPPLIDMSGFSPYVSTRTLSHLKYEEPEIQLTRVDPLKTTTISSEKKFIFMNGDLLLGPERDSLAQRRMRWIRQAERVGKPRLEAENQKTPSPVPPKLTRSNNIINNGAGHNNVSQEARNVRSNQESCKTEDAELNDRDENKSCAPHSFQPAELIPSKLQPSPRLIRGSFICTIRDKNTALAAGETGLVAKGPPENVEICEEKSLTPSLAASIFDPKVQLEKEKEKQEAERALRASNREGMPSSQFKANIRLFEQATESARDKFSDSKVKANVKMFENVTKAQRAHSVSPERRKNGRQKRSFSVQRPTLENFLTKDVMGSGQ